MPLDQLESEIEIPEWPEDARLAHALKERGLEDLGIAAEFQVWTEAREAERDRGGDKEAVEVEVRRGLLYWNAGLHDEARQAWGDALEYLAEPSGKVELIQLLQAVLRAHS